MNQGSSNSSNDTSLKHSVFWPPFLLLLGAVILSFVNMDAFAKVMNGTNNWLFKNFAWLFNLGVLAMVIAIAAIYFSPLGKVKIGGANAVPLLSPWKWWAVTLCTGIAIGILFWATAEPMYHLTAPPESWGIKPNSPEAAVFALSTLFLHWTISPYAIYTVPAIMFAFAYYNMRKPFSLGSTVYPLLGERSLGSIGKVIDSICLFALVAGMASSLGAGILSISGGMDYLFGIKSGPATWFVVDIVIVVTFVISAITGLTNGIKILSDLNAKIFIGLAIFVFIVGPTAYSLNLGTEALADFLTNFFKKSLFTGAAAGDQWPQWWTIFYWAAWLAWAPITAVFLGRIGYGYTIRAFILVNFVTPAIFGALWFIIFSGAAIHMELVQKLGLAAVLAEKGAEGTIYFFFSQYPLAMLTIPIFIFTMFLSFVTGSDAMTSAMGGMCSTGISPESPEPKMWLKIVWGAILGAVAWVMMAFRGLDGLKMVNTFGGFPALLLEIAVLVALVKVALNPQKYDTFKDDYAADGSYRYAGSRQGVVNPPAASVEGKNVVS